jgi:hypothetical protein
MANTRWLDPQEAHSPMEQARPQRPELGPLVTPPFTEVRTPPHSIEAEQSVLGGLLLEPAALQGISTTLTSEHFYAHQHQLIYTVVLALVSEGKPVDVITVNERLGAQSAEVGGLKYLHSLAMSVPSAAHIERYAEIIVERSTLRDVIALANEAIGAAHRQGPAAKVLDDVKLALGKLAGAGAASTSVPMMSLAELQAHSQSVSWLVKHVIPAESIGMMYGGSGTFKSFIALDAALHIAHGLPWMGRKTRRGGVIYVAAEGGAGLWARIDAWHRVRRLKVADADLQVVPAAVNLTEDAWRVVEAAQIRGLSPALVVVDTLSQTYAGEENSANEMAAYFRELGNRFRALWQCAVLLLHHTGHQATERPRGSSAIRANLDFMLGVFRDEKEMLATLTCAKQKDGDVFADTMFSLSVQELGRDPDGEVLTSLVARHLTSTEEISQAMEREVAAGRGGQKQLLVSMLQNGSKVTDLRKAFIEACGHPPGSDAGKQAWSRCSGWAVREGLMEISQGHVITLNRGAKK